MKLIEWRQAWRLWSLRVCAAAAALYAALLALPDQAHAIWLQLPPQIRELIPHHDQLALIIVTAVAIARVIRQRPIPSGTGGEPRA